MATNLTATLSIDTGPAISNLQKLHKETANVGDIKAAVKLDSGSVNKFVSDVKAATSGVAVKPVEIPVKPNEQGLTGWWTKMKARFTGEAGDAGKSAGNKFSDMFKASAADMKGALMGGLIGGGVAGAVSTGVSALIGGFKSAMELGQQFEQDMAALSAVTGVTGEALTNLGDMGRQLAKDFGGEASTQLAAFQGILSKFGPQLAGTPEALGEITKNVNILAKAGGLDAAQSMDTLANSMLQMGVNVEDADEAARESARFINVLAASAQVGAAEIPQVGEAFLQAGVAVKGSNVSFEEANAALQVLAAGGKVGSEAGIGLRNVLASLQKQSGEGEKALKKMGLSTKELGTTLTTQGVGAAMEKLNAGLATLGSDYERNAAMATIFGKENAAAAGMLAQGAGTIREWTAEITNTTAAYDQAATNMNTLGEMFNRMKSVVADFGISIYQGLSAVLVPVINIFKTVLGPVIQKTFASFQGYFSKLWAVAKPILMAIGGAIIANIVTSLTVTITAIGTFYDILSKVFDAVLRSLTPIIDMFRSWFGGMGEGVDIMKLFTDGLQIFAEIASEVGSVVGELAGIVVEVLVSGLDMLMAVLKPIINLFKGAKEETTGVGQAANKSGSFIDGLRKIFDNIKGTLRGVAVAFRETKNIIGEFFEALSSFNFAKIAEILAGSGERISRAYDRGFNDVVARAKEAREEAARAKAEAEAAAEVGAEAARTGAGAAGSTASALEKALKKYNDIKQAIATARKEEAARLEVLQKIGAITSEEAEIKLKEIDREAANKLFQQAQEIFKATVDKEGLFISTKIKLNKDETTNDIRQIFADLAPDVALSIKKITITPSVDLSNLAKELHALKIEPVKIDFVPTEDSFTKLSKQLSNSFIDAFGNIKWDALFEVPEDITNEAAKKVVEDARAGILSYQDAMGKLRDGATETESFYTRLQSAISGAYIEVLNANTKLIQDTTAKIASLASEREAIEADMGLSSEEKNAKLLDNNKETTKQTELMYSTLATATGAALGTILAGTEESGKALKKFAITIASSLVDVYVVPMIASYISTLGPFALPAAKAMAALLKAMLASVISGFKEGGYTGDGNDNAVAGVVHGREFVHTARVTKENRALFEHLHRGGQLHTWQGLPAILAKHNISMSSSAAHVTPLPVAGLEARLDGIAKQLRRMERISNKYSTVTVQADSSSVITQIDNSRWRAARA